MSNALHSPARHARVALTLVLAALAIAACGGSSDGGSDGIASLDGATGAETGPTTTLSAADIEAQYLVWADCMTGQGLEVPELTVDAEGNPSLAPGAGGGDDGEAANGPVAADREAMAAGIEVCGEPPAGLIGGGGGGPANNEEFQDAALEFAQCMRDNGVDVPDPDFSEQPPADGDAPEGGGGGGGGIFGGAVDPDDPTVQAAMEQCQDLLGDLGRGPGATTTVAP